MKSYAKIILRNDFVKKDGTYPICLRVTINRKVKVYSLNISVTHECWISNKCQVKKSFPNSYKINLIISQAKTRADEIIFDYEINHKALTVGEFNRLYSIPGINSNSFYEFVSKELEILKPKFSYYTIKTYKGHISKLKDFAPELTFSDITISFIKDYDNYLINRGNNENTRLKAKTVLKSLLNKAIEAGHIKENIFKGIKIGSKPGNREALTIDEFEKLKNLLNTDLKKPLQNVLTYFIFSCYTGLRYQDIRDLRYSHIKNNIVRMEMHKTRDLVTIPLSDKAIKIAGTGYEAQKVFRVFANQVTNRYLKDLMNIAEIEKKITFHCARHTFATIGLTIGMSFESISKILGHKDFKTTDIYAKMADEVKVREMDKWNKL